MTSDDTKVFLSIVLMGVLVGLVIGKLNENAIKEIKQDSLLFSCHILEGIACTVTANKDKPCSYTVVQCRAPDHSIILQSERNYESR